MREVFATLNTVDRWQILTDYCRTLAAYAPVTALTPADWDRLVATRTAILDDLCDHHITAFLAEDPHRYQRLIDGDPEPDLHLLLALAHG